ncbi:hypothetical protein BGW39_003375 [Mortierella sp. 14UC]|nr:hypothetical protein BGW39_003375 [Mortierella sp. 14UC]
MLEHAIKNEWVCSRLRELEIAVKLTLDGREPEYMADTSKATWTEDDRRHWQDLGKFYRKIGSLVNVEILVLKAVGQFRTPISHNQYRINYLNPSKTCLPGLLTLEDPAAGQIGYLTTLSGLNKLRDLRGSFVWTNQETIARLSEREVDWFVSHLPALKVATFIGDEDSGELAHSSLVLKLHQTLKERRPEIRICHVEPLVVPRQSYTSLH